MSSDQSQPQGNPDDPSLPLFDATNCRSLYIGNLNNKITDALLYEIFSTLGAIESCKLIKDKTTGLSSGYGFVDYYDHQTAALALSSLNGKSIYGNEVKVNWAFAGSHKEDTSSHFHIFVGDLSPELDDKALYNAFSAFGSISDARVMWDQNTGRSRGYGFVAFRAKGDAERALTEMNGEWLGTRAIRCNWANQKLASAQTETVNLNDFNMAAAGPVSTTNTTVYVGNLTPDVSDSMIRAVFADYGPIEEIRMQKDKGFAFVRYQTHEGARAAITGMHGKIVGVRAVKCSWGKERTPSASPQLRSQPMMPPHPQGYGYQMPYYQQAPPAAYGYQPSPYGYQPQPAYPPYPPMYNPGPPPGFHSEHY